MMRTLDLAALRSFLAIVEHGGVTRAAKRLNLTQSAVSMQLKRLEDGLGHILLDRARKGMTPTAAGEQLASYARRMLELNDEALARLTEPSYQGDLTLGAPHDVVYPHIPQVLRLFARTYPRVRVQLQSSYTSVLKDQFARGEVDVILTTELAPDQGSEVLQAGPLVWIGAPGGQAYRQRPLPLAFENGCIFRPWVQRALDAAHIPWVMAVESLSIRTVEATVAADFAVHAGIEDTLPPQLAQIDHGGQLPPLPTTYIAMYVSDGPNAGLAHKLAEVIRNMWAASAPLDVPAAAE
ncbi:LysR family transcriptional regulator [Acuticoccus sp. I52.16.1]|uniref:LysR family transcriptional regulator n=1 Tax=Acuticoccus sp. I52.16.1 TaxID=2928472 RepID=UPI001FCFC09B|nr:LysR family transcriptional regulator [Acuticoccus sp. I52.16.1]UOM36402.1 LysR family transcriptional regulator [Acuticoccus sp. I52.16.1]